MKTLASFLSAGVVALALYGGSASGSPAFSIEAHLVDAVENAGKRAVMVEVTVRGIRLADPSAVPQARGRVEVHLHYRLDEESTIATASRKLAFRDLSPGTHRLLIYLADGNQLPIGMPVSLTVRIPADKTVMSY